MFFDGYRDRVTGIERCAVHLPSLKLEEGNPGFTYELALQALASRGIEIVRVDVVKVAKGCLGTPYRCPASLGDAPDFFDCSSLMVYVYGAKGIRLPRIAIDQRDNGPGELITSVNQLVAGDLIFKTSDYGFYRDDPDDSVGHVGLVTGEGTVIHASSSRRGVVEDSLERFLTNREFRLGRRIIPVGIADEVITLQPPQGLDLDSSDTVRWRLLSEMSRLRR